MCGIAGMLSPGGFQPDDAKYSLGRMIARLTHRGPDDDGLWLDAMAGIALGHRRLSVLDLSEAGHQPMESAGRRYVMAFNGEIYNHSELRRELGAVNWRGHSDTETLLAGIEAWGLPTCIRRAVGMFAIALWDREERRLSLIRDRLGEKPLYFGWMGKVFLFASELKSLQEFPGFSATVDRDALNELMRYGYVQAPRSIYSDICKVMPGNIFEIDAIGGGPGGGGATAYWSIDEVAERGLRNQFSGDPEEAVSELERLLANSVRGQMIADVPLGAFLSGGIDSSTVVALMQRHSSQAVKTYTIGFVEQQYDEAVDARAVASFLRTDHSELYVSADDARELVPQLIDVYSEPFADMSQLPTILVSRLARRDVTVALTGDGGDELFCGYGRYPQAVRAWTKLARVPLFLRTCIRPLLSRGTIKAGIASKTLDDFYLFMNTQWKEYPDLVLGTSVTQAPPSFPAGLDSLQRMMLADTKGYLPDDILTKVDRAAMSVSLESRIPLLDHRVVEFAWSLPTTIRFRDGVGKWPLKELLYRLVPSQMVDRPKKGFGVPMQHWLRTSLREWGEDLLDETRLRQEGYFDHRAVLSEWKSHLDGNRDRHYALWAVLMFQAWLSANRNNVSGICDEPQSTQV